MEFQTLCLLTCLQTLIVYYSCGEGYLRLNCVCREEYRKMAGKKTEYYKKKRRFRGNQHAKGDSGKKSETNHGISASARKVITDSNRKPNFNQDVNSVNIIVDVNIMITELQRCLKCVCGESVDISFDRISGLACNFSIMCKKCLEIGSFCSSARIGRNNNILSVNRQFVYAMRCIGQGLASMKVFCGLMNMHPPVEQSTYDLINETILAATNEVTADSLSNAAELETKLTNSSDITVSCDGTWLTRGHTSRFGVCTVIGSKTGMVIDTKVLSSNCKSCETWKGKETTVEYAEWKEEHADVCGINHSGNAGGMEVAGMVDIFRRSVEKHKVRYVSYIGDGDTRSHKAVCNVEPYGKDIVITKLECVGHVQKRMGYQLRKKKQELKGVILEDGKKISGKNRLTDSVINTLSVYYGNAIREYSSSVNDMRRGIWAIWYHKSSSDDKPMHYFCPSGPESWCSYKRAVHEGTAADYTHKNNIAPAIMNVIKPVFKNLVATDLLKRCVGGHTQNNNESLNSKIWKLCPKTGFAGHKIVEIAVNDASLTFNDGMAARMKVMEKLSLNPGMLCQQALTGQDHLRVKIAEKRASESTKEARICRKRLRLHEQAQNTSEEGPEYEAGAF